jgi:hypothetical protein
MTTLMESNKFIIMNNIHEDVMGDITIVGNGDIGHENVLSPKKTKVVEQHFQANVVHEDKEKEKYVGIDDKKQ